MTYSIATTIRPVSPVFRWTRTPRVPCRYHRSEKAEVEWPATRLEASFSRCTKCFPEMSILKIQLITKRQRSYLQTLSIGFHDWVVLNPHGAPHDMLAHVVASPFYAVQFGLQEWTSWRFEWTSWFPTNEMMLVMQSSRLPPLAGCGIAISAESQVALFPPFYRLLSQYGFCKFISSPHLITYLCIALWLDTHLRFHVELISNPEVGRNWNRKRGDKIWIIGRILMKELVNSPIYRSIWNRAMLSVNSNETLCLTQTNATPTEHIR